MQENIGLKSGSPVNSETAIFQATTPTCSMFSKLSVSETGARWRY